MHVSRPDGGPVNVAASRWSGSIAGLDEAPPRISLEGDDLTFTAGPGASVLAGEPKNVPCTPAPDPSEAALFLSLDGGLARPESLVGQLAGGKPVAMRLDGVISHTDQLTGESWCSYVQHWSSNGGTFDVHQLTLSAGDAALSASKGGVAVADNGQVEGVLEATLRGESRVLAIARTGEGAGGRRRRAHDPSAPLRLTFRDGGTWLGPVKLAPARAPTEPDRQAGRGC